MTYKIYSVILILFAILPSQVAAEKGTSSPNIILIFSDDQGWCDTSILMNPERQDSHKGIYQTPNLERLANAGMVFSQGYSGAPQCAPSRGAMMFGKTPARLAHTTNAGDYLVKDRSHFFTIPKAIKQVNPDYVTAHLGKWHIPGLRPGDAGFDVHDGRTGNGGGERYEQSDRAPHPPEDPKQLYTLSERACDFIADRAKANEPF